MLTKQRAANHRGGVVGRKERKIIAQRPQVVRGDTPVRGEGADDIDLPIGQSLVHQARIKVRGSGEVKPVDPA